MNVFYSVSKVKQKTGKERMKIVQGYDKIVQIYPTLVKKLFLINRK